MTNERVMAHTPSPTFEIVNAEREKYRQQVLERLRKEARERLPQWQEFLSELHQLYAKHNVIVSSCGCCGSPWLVAPDQYTTVINAIDHLKSNYVEVKKAE